MSGFNSLPEVAQRAPADPSKPMNSTFGPTAAPACQLSETWPGSAWRRFREFNTPSATWLRIPKVNGR